MRRIVVLLLDLVLLVLCLFACDKKDDDKEYVAIVSAMDNEIATLLEEANIERVDEFGGVKYHVGTLRGQNVVIARSGIGKVRSSSVATTMFNQYKIKSVLFTGIAGGVKDGTEILDVVISTRLVEHDYGTWTNDGFIWTSGDPGMGVEPGEYYVATPEMVELAYNSAIETIDTHEYAVYKGTIATGDQFIASEDVCERLRTDYDAYACEMEGASVAVICIRYAIPFVVIRALSDKADGAAHDSYENFGDIAAQNSSKIVLKMLEKM